MKDELDYALQKLTKALLRLKEGIAAASDSLSKDGVIQRFEFTFELFWKMLMFLLRNEGFECVGPRSCIKESARRGFLLNGETALDMLEDRNKTSHIYDESTAEEIFENIKSEYLHLLEDNLKLFKDYINRQD